MPPVVPVTEVGVDGGVGAEVQVVFLTADESPTVPGQTVGQQNHAALQDAVDTVPSRTTIRLYSTVERAIFPLSQAVILDAGRHIQLAGSAVQSIRLDAPVTSDVDGNRLQTAFIIDSSEGSVSFLRLRDFLFFDRVVVRGSISAAAQELGIPKPKASRWLKQLESTLGQTLIKRATRHAALTDRGEAFVELARELLALAGRAHQVGSGDQPSGTLRVSVPA